MKAKTKKASPKSKLWQSISKLIDPLIKIVPIVISVGTLIYTSFLPGSVKVGLDKRIALGFIEDSGWSFTINTRLSNSASPNKETVIHDLRLIATIQGDRSSDEIDCKWTETQLLLGGRAFDEKYKLSTLREGQAGYKDYFVTESRSTMFPIKGNQEILKWYRFEIPISVDTLISDSAGDITFTVTLKAITESGGEFKSEKRIYRMPKAYILSLKERRNYEWAESL